MLCVALTVGVRAVKLGFTFFSLTPICVIVGLLPLIGRIGCQQSVPGCAVPIFVSGYEE